MINLHSKQTEVISTKERFIAAIAGIQGGKTTVGSIWFCDKIWRAHEAGIHGDWLIAAPTHKILQQSTLPKFKEYFPEDWGVWKENRSVFELGFGGNIFVRSTDDPDCLEGMTLLGAWLDEVGQMKSQVWINIQGRVAVAQGPVLMTTSRYMHQKWLQRDVLSKAGIDPNIKVISWASVDNPGFPKEEFERAKASLPDAIFRSRYLAEDCTLEGLVYPDFNEESIIKPFIIPEGWSRFGGLDFGQENPTALLCIAEDPKSHIFYAFREFYKSHSLLKDVADIIMDTQLKYVLGDPQSAQLIAELARHYSLNVKPADNSIDVGVERLTVLFKEGRLKIFSTLENTIDEIGSYHYAVNDGNKPFKDKPIAKKNHAMDALRYAFSKNIERNLYSKYALSDRVPKRYIPQETRRSRLVDVDSYTGY